MKFFHFAPMKLGPGSVIEPGNFGRVMKATQIAAQGNPSSIVSGYLARELLFELIRVQEFPDKPSRMEGIFGCPTIEDAHSYARENNTDGRQVLHEVEMIDIAAPVHDAWIGFCDIQMGIAFYDTTEHRARLYWAGTAGDASRAREMIVKSPVRILRSV